MTRFVIVVCALGLWASPVAAQELQLAHPTLTAHADRCSSHLRSMCQGIGRERALGNGLSCDACSPAPMPAELVAPRSAATHDRRNTDGECLPRASGPLPSTCAKGPRLDHIPRP